MLKIGTKVTLIDELAKEFNMPGVYTIDCITSYETYFLKEDELETEFLQSNLIEI